MLKRKLWGDIWQYKVQFLSIFIMCFLGVFIYSGIYSEWGGMKHNSDQFYEAQNLADIWIQGDLSMVENLDEIKGVEQWEKRTLCGGRDRDVLNSRLDLYLINEHTISTMQVQVGKAYEQGEKGIYLDAQYAKEHQLKLQDTLRIQVEGISMDIAIVALIDHPEYVYALKDETAMVPNHSEYAFAFLSKTAYEEFSNIADNQMIIKGNMDTKRIKDDIQTHSGKGSFQIMDRSDHASYASLQSEIEQHQAVGAIFPVIFLFIAMLSTLNTMNKLIANQRIQIGTLYALGFQKRKLYLHYLSHVTLLCALGGLLGFMLGPLCVPPLIYEMLITMYRLPVWKGVMDIHLLIVCLLAVSLCIATSFIAIKRVLHEQAAQIMRPKTTIVKHVSKNPSRIWHHFSFYTQWNLRDSIRCKARSLMAIVGIMGCCSLLICSLGLMDSIYKMLDIQFEELHIYESKINIEPTISSAQLEHVKDVSKGSELMEGLAMIQGFDGEEVAPLYVQENSTYLSVNNSDLELPKEGIVLSQKLADKLLLEVGDTLTWKTIQAEKWNSSIVKDIQYSPLTQGLSMSIAYYETLAYDYQTTTILSGERYIQEMIGVSSVQYRDSLRQEMDTMLESMQALVMVLILSATVLGFVVLYNFTSLSFFERTREMATLKVFGFTNAKIRYLCISQNLQLCLVGIIFGIPMGYFMIMGMAETLSKNMDLPVYISMTSFLFAILFTFMEAYVISLWIARKCKDIDMVSSLKSME